MKTKHQFQNQPWIQVKKLLTTLTGVPLLLLAVSNSPAQTYEIVHSFCCDRSLGIGPVGRLEQGPDGTLYGTTEHGGYDPTPYYIYGGFGTVFKVKTDGSGYTVLKQFHGDDGASPEAGLVLSGTTLYGTTYSGHTSDNSIKGVVFKVDTDGSGFTVLKSFRGGNDGSGPVGELVLSGNTLYGTTMYGGSYGYGTLFKVNIDGSGYAILKNFPLGSDSFPRGRLLLAGTTLYGTASCWPTYSDVTSYYGCVFKVNTDGSGYTVLASFAGGTDGARPIGNLTSSGTTLYGTTFYGGGNGGDLGRGCGTVFKVNMDGTGYTVLKRLSDDAWGPSGDLALSGSTLYGTTQEGGSPGRGNVFKIGTDGSGFVAFKHFTTTNGYQPSGGVMLSGTTLYGNAYWGGPGAGNTLAGVVFGLSTAPPIINSPPANQTAERGDSIYFSVSAGSWPQGYVWFFNGTNFISYSTDPSLVLTNIQFSQLGDYTAVVTNLFGAVTSTPAMLQVILPVERRPVPCINVMGEPGSALNVEYSEELGALADWQPFDTISLISTSQFCFDVTVPLPPERFYRAWQAATPGVLPSLDLHVVPAITLTGNVDDTLRLDYINAIGPTDAWVTLDTVTLTNTSQLCFDVSSIGQPQRLYRIVPVP